jgi:hypothetical protein
LQKKARLPADREAEEKIKKEKIRKGSMRLGAPHPNKPFASSLVLGPLARRNVSA